MERLGHLISAYFRGVLVVWGLLLVVLGYFAYQLPDRLEGNGFTRDGDFQRVETVLAQEVRSNNLASVSRLQFLLMLRLSGCSLSPH